MNTFKPLSEIVDQVWNDTAPDQSYNELQKLISEGKIGTPKNNLPIVKPTKTLQQAYTKIIEAVEQGELFDLSATDKENTSLFTPSGVKPGASIQKKIWRQIDPGDFTYSDQDIAALNKLSSGHKQKILKLIYSTQIEAPLDFIFKHSKFENSSYFKSRIINIIESNLSSLDDVTYCLGKIEQSYKDKVSLLNISKILTTGRSYTFLELFNGDEKLSNFFYSLREFGRGYKKAGPFEWALVFISPSITSAKKGDIEIDGVKFEIKADKGRLLAGEVHPRQDIINAIQEVMRVETGNKNWNYSDRTYRSLSYYAFFKELVSTIPTLDGKRRLVKAVFDLILGTPYTEHIMHHVSNEITSQNDKEIFSVLNTVAGEMFSKYKQHEGWEGIIAINSKLQRTAVIYTKEQFISSIESRVFEPSPGYYGAAVISGSQKEEHWYQVDISN